MSNTILKGFNLSTAQHRGEGDSLLLKNFLAGDSGKRERSVQPSTASASLFPAHICASSADTKEWLAEKNKAVAEAVSGKANIMAPVLKSTSAEYWLDRENRPPVNERVPDPSISLWLAAPRPMADGVKTDAETGESSPKKPRIDWPKDITEYSRDTWLAGTTSCVGNTLWLAGHPSKTPVDKTSACPSLDTSWAMPAGQQNGWLADGQGDVDEVPEEGEGATDSEVDVWLAKNVANFSLGQEADVLIGDGESSIEVLEDGDYDLIEGEEEDEDDSIEIDLAKWLVID